MYTERYFRNTVQRFSVFIPRAVRRQLQAHSSTVTGHDRRRRDMGRGGEEQVGGEEDKSQEWSVVSQQNCHVM